MIIIDFLFKICYAPFHKAIKGGSLGALFSLSPSLTLIITGIINILFYFSLGRITLILSPLVLSILMLLLFILVYFLLNKIYIKNEREVKAIRYPVIYGLLLPIFFIGSIVFFVFTIDKFG